MQVKMKTLSVAPPGFPDSDQEPLAHKQTAGVFTLRFKFKKYAKITFQAGAGLHHKVEHVTQPAKCLWLGGSGVQRGGGAVEIPSVNAPLKGKGTDE